MLLKTINTTVKVTALIFVINEQDIRVYNDVSPAPAGSYVLMGQKKHIMFATYCIGNSKGCLMEI